MIGSRIFNLKDALYWMRVTGPRSHAISLVSASYIAGTFMAEKSGIEMQKDPSSREAHDRAWSKKAAQRGFKRLAAANRSVLMLDYDGTLAPFVQDRMSSKLYPGVEERLHRLSRLTGGKLVFVTGRPVRELRALLPQDIHAEMWGSHGREQLSAEGGYQLTSLSQKQIEELDWFDRSIGEKGFGSSIERKASGLALHTRGLDSDQARDLRALAETLFAQIEPSGAALEMLPFDGGLEVRGKGCTKATAVEHILKQEPQGTFAAYLGDDQTDEDAFCALGDQGLRVLVRNEFRPTLANLWLKPPQELLEFLDGWLAAVSTYREEAPSPEGISKMETISGVKGAPSTSLVVVSNRIPLSFAMEQGKLTATPSSGGLVSALEPLLKEHGGVWIGSAGTQDSPEIRAQLKEATCGHHYHYEPLFLSEEEQAKYYEGFSNEVLWPLFHDLQTHCVFKPIYWDFYRRVNQKFAEAVLHVTREEDIVWVQDYQLLQVATSIRAQRPRSRIAFFLHIPFPPPDIFEKLPWRREILQGLLDYDFIGLQTERDQRNLVACLRTFIPEIKLDGRGDHRKVVSARGVTLIQVMPISIDFHELASVAASEAVSSRAAEIRCESPGLCIALGIDRLDYTKGIPERLRAFRALLRDQPEFRRKITLIQVVVPSRENIPRYQELHSEVEKLVSSVNGELAEPGWTPIQYMHRSVSHEELLALYKAAHIALVTPLKDGMNLVAKEYCAAHVEDDGVLILSEFAGAAPELKTGAILVNPYDEVGVANALKQAIEMPVKEQRRRMLRLRHQIQSADIHHWRDLFFASLKRVE
ncbi:trehalose-phosphatase [Granulicella mallensis]|nr:trehalose-phosphatase [Granulicella mallensis]